MQAVAEATSTHDQTAITFLVLNPGTVVIGVRMEAASTAEAAQALPAH